MITTPQADGAGTVNVFENHYPLINEDSKVMIETKLINMQQTVVLPPTTGRKELELSARRKSLWNIARKLNINAIINGRRGASVGFVSSGCAYMYLKHALMELGLWGEYPILKLGITYPIDPEVILNFYEMVDTIVVVEEKRSFVESQILTILNESQPSSKKPNQDPSLGLRVYGKKFPEGQDGFPETLGLNPSLAEQKIAWIIDRLGDKKNPKKATSEVDFLEMAKKVQMPLPERTPTFCPGCPHRDSSSVLKDIKKDFTDTSYMKKYHNSGPVDLLFHGDTGCYSMLVFEPNKDLMHNYSGMGLGGGTGAGIDPFILNKQVVFMGDSTFFHSGYVAISNAFKNKQDITFIILDNETTAMTGHQPTPGIDVDILNEKTPVQKIDAMVKSIGKKKSLPVIRMNPENWELYKKILERNILLNGVKVIIAEKRVWHCFPSSKQIARNEGEK